MKIYQCIRNDMDSLLRFRDRLNGMHPSITFSLSYDLIYIHFLDVLVYKDQKGQLGTSMYTKPTERNQILHDEGRNYIVFKFQHRVSHPRVKKPQGGRIPFVTQFSCNSDSGKQFVHPLTGHSVQLWDYYTCISKFVIYVLIFLCGLIYTGETTQMVKPRISQHRSAINLGNTLLPVSKHFVEKGHTSDQLKFMVLESVPPLKRGLNRDHDLFLFL
ncbi:hypothetical protein XELAEV_18012592mg [Xenopus laevis]|uniref:Uncharacterized protein n=1 Tax=Xenopus laevis TaxID=8355 RepID=A0A974HYE0_XENLA|nr:hypothetical protein XELAEV_18012592mg [Xenopus laevis]